MKTMVSKFNGTCRDCGGHIASGTKIVYHGKGAGISCMACSLESDEPAESADTEAEAESAFGLEPGTLASDRRLARRGLTVVRFSSGESMTQNSRGRCEDAPCCGCCS